MQTDAVNRHRMAFGDSNDHQVMPKQAHHRVSQYGMRKMSTDTFVQKQSSPQRYKTTNNCNIPGFAVRPEEEIQGKTISPSPNKQWNIGENYNLPGKQIPSRKQKIQVISSPRSSALRQPVELKSPRRKGIERFSQVAQSKFLQQNHHQGESVYQQKPQSFHQGPILDASVQPNSNNYFNSPQITQSVQISTNVVNKPQRIFQQHSKSEHEPQAKIQKVRIPQIHANNYQGYPQPNPVICKMPMNIPNSPQNPQFYQNSSPNSQRGLSPKPPQVSKNLDPQYAPKPQMQAPQNNFRFQEQSKKQSVAGLTQSNQFAQRNTQEQPNRKQIDQSPNKQKSDKFAQMTQASNICPTDTSNIAPTNSSFFKDKQSQKSNEKIPRINSLQNRVKVSKSIFVPDEVTYTSFGQQYRFGSDAHGIKKQGRDPKRELNVKDSMQRSGVPNNLKANTFEKAKLSVSRMFGDS